MNGPSGDWPDEFDERHTVELATLSGVPVTVDFMIRPEAVEIWFKERRRAILNRHVLRVWLAEPQTPLVAGGVALSLDGMVSARTRKNVNLADLLVWILSPQTLAGLRQRI